MTTPTKPVVRVAPLGEIRAYTVYEHELDELAHGAWGSIHLNVGLALLPVAITICITLATITVESDRLFTTFVVVAIACGLVGVISLLFWVRDFRRSKNCL